MNAPLIDDISITVTEKCFMLYSHIIQVKFSRWYTTQLTASKKSNPVSIFTSSSKHSKELTE